MTQDHQVLPDWKLERYLLGELPGSEVEAIRRQAEVDEVLRNRLSALEQSNEELRERYRSDWMVDQVQRRLNETSVAARRRTSRAWLWALVPAAAAIVLLIRTANQPLLQNRLKGGGPQLQMFRKAPAGVEQLENGHTAAEGDLIRIRYRTGRHPYGVILSVDGRGTVTVHLPEKGTTAAALEPGRTDMLGFAYELDDAPRWERFYFVTNPSPFDVSPILNGIDKQRDPPDSLALGAAFAQQTFTIRKVPRDAP